MKIHGLVYVILGVLMAIYARFIQSKINNNSMVLFFWVGVGFIFFGVFRLVIDYVFNKKSKSENLSKFDKMDSGKFSVERKAVSSKYSLEKEIVACSRCGTRHYKTSNFCHMCGFSLKN